MRKKLKSILGMTFIELMTTIVIIGITATLAEPSFNRAIDRIKFKNINKDVISALRLARSAAIAEKVSHGIYFNSSGYTVLQFRDINDNLAYDEGVDPLTRIDTLPSGMTSLSTDFVGGDVIVFLSNGTASGTGNIYLTSETESGHVNSSQLSVLAATGRA
ncbi:MAG: GspH/FimT family pseudopilin, partial [candidate division Zixibacteria bacterium]|nr:GspH/FimT family pseudopilin [candidate division Zixibacteria bacterium]